MSYIEKEPLVEFITKGLNNPDKSKAFGYDAIEILTEIEYAPTADVVEVVRCKDCKWWEAWITGSTIGRCENPRNGLVNEYSEETDFCSYGERKE